MSKPKSKKPNPAKKSAAVRKGKGGGDARGKQALRGIALGGMVIALAAAFFMLPIGGQTVFSRLIHALSLSGEETPAVKAPKSGLAAPASMPVKALAKATAAGHAPAGLATHAPARAPGHVPSRIKLASNLADRRPMEAATADDDASLERLVRRHAK